MSIGALAFVEVSPRCLQGVTVAAFELATAATRARVIAPGSGEGLSHSGFFKKQDLHHLPWSPVPTQEIGHDFHGMFDMVEEVPVGRTKVVEPWFSVRGINKAILGASAVAGKQYIAFSAQSGKAVSLVEAELLPFVGSHQLGQRRMQDVAQEVAWVDKVIARIKVAVVFQHGGIAASG